LDDPMLMASIAPLSIASSKSRFGFDVEISQRFPLGGKLEAQEALAAAETRSASSDFSETRLKLALIASDLFDDYALAVRSIAIEADHIALVSALKENATALYASGNATAQDALQADAELARLEYQVSLYETQRDVAVAQLNALLHRVPTAALPPPSAAASQERDNAEVDAAGLATAIDKRPDVVAAAARVRVAGARVEVAEREAYPDLTVSTSYNSMWDMPEHRWMAGVGVNIPLQRERRRGALDEASAMRAAAESEVQSTADMARGELAVAARQLQQARRAVQLYEQHLLPLARERIEAARASFTAAQTTFMSVIEAERGFRTAELELELARADLSKRKAGLERALGRVPGVSNSEVQP
jgi:outer membrane protein TolC